MKSLFTINFEYQYTIRQAETLENIARQLDGCHKRYAACDSRIAAAWKGENSSFYRSKLSVAENNTEKMRAYIMELAQTIRRIAKRTYDTEMKNLEISRQRTYH